MSKRDNCDSFIHERDLQKLFDECDNDVNQVAQALNIISGSEDENCDSSDNETEGKCK